MRGRAVARFDLFNSMPPELDVNYEYSWRPWSDKREDPLIPDSILFHMMVHPKGVIKQLEGEEYRRRLPKRKTELAYDNDEHGFPYGWGLEFQQGFHWRFFLSCELLGFLLTLIAMGLWIGISKARKADSVPAASTIGAFLLRVPQLGYVFALTLSTGIPHWKY